MCGLENLKVTVNLLATLKAIISLITIIIGGILVGDKTYGLAYGSGLVGASSIVIIVGVFSFVSVFPLYFSVKRHNRAFILFNFMGDVVFLLIMLSIGTTFYKYTIPKFSKSLQLDCLKGYPSSHTEEQCREYFRSDRTAGFRLVWSSFFTRVSINYPTMNSLQILGACCGFGPPFRCLNDTRPFPDIPYPNAVSSSLTQQRLQCGHHKSNNPKQDYYVQQFNCLEYYDQTVTPAIIGGCEYDLGIGSCVSDDVGAFSKGCGSTMEDYMASKMLGPTYFILCTTAVNLLCIILCFMMYTKRKHEDVFPTYELDLKYGHVDFKNVKDQFVVRPHNNILVKRGFLNQDAANARKVAISETGDDQEETKVNNNNNSNNISNTNQEITSNNNPIPVENNSV